MNYYADIKVVPNFIEVLRDITVKVQIEQLKEYEFFVKNWASNSYPPAGGHATFLDRLRRAIQETRIKI